MNDRAVLLNKLNEIEKLARGHILIRFFNNPIKYISAVGYWRFIYPIKKKGKFAKSTTFFGEDMQMVLPSATEIFLFGAKTHDSEIRLARFLIQHLNKGEVFCDVGAHYGFFTLLASLLVGENGKVVSLEASKNTFTVFYKNIEKNKNIVAENKAAFNTNEILVFNEYPVLYSEYNSLIEQKINGVHLANEIKIQGVRLDEYFSKNNLCPKIIKIDVEGAELQVMQGLSGFLEKENPVLIMEYLMEENQNEAHEKAILFLKKLNYQTHIIDRSGKYVLCDDVKMEMQKRSLDSDNIVFIKK